MISQAARRLYADQLRAQGPGYANLAGAVEARQHDSSFWVRPALMAIEQALRFGEPDMDDEFRPRIAYGQR